MITIMRRLLLLLTGIVAVAAVQAKNVKVTIDGTVAPGQTTLYLIVNEDTAHAQLLPIKDARFSVKVKVERDAFIRLQDNKKWPERSNFVLIPDSRHITIDWNTGAIKGSEMSQKLNATCNLIRSSDPGNFHIDVFSEDPEAWRKAREQANVVRTRMQEEQKSIARDILLDKKDSIIAVWIAYCYPQLFEGELNDIIDSIKPLWANHPLLKKRIK